MFSPNPLTFREIAPFSFFFCCDTRFFFGFFSFFLHVSELCHHRFQKRVKTSIFDKNQKGIARWKATTVLFNWVHSYSTLRFHRKHYLLPNLIENRKSWKHGHNGPNVTVPYKTQNFWPLLCKDEEKLRHFLLQGFIPTHSQATIRRRGQISEVTPPPPLYTPPIIHHLYIYIMRKNKKSIWPNFPKTIFFFFWRHEIRWKSRKCYPFFHPRPGKKVDFSIPSGKHRELQKLIIAGCSSLAGHFNCYIVF